MRKEHSTHLLDCQNKISYTIMVQFNHIAHPSLCVTPSSPLASVSCRPHVLPLGQQHTTECFYVMLKSYYIVDVNVFPSHEQIILQQIIQKTENLCSDIISLAKKKKKKSSHELQSHKGVIFFLCRFHHQN